MTMSTIWSVTWLYPAKFAYVRCRYHPFLQCPLIWIYTTRSAASADSETHNVIKSMFANPKQIGMRSRSNDSAHDFEVSHGCTQLSSPTSAVAIIRFCNAHWFDSHDSIKSIFTKLETNWDTLSQLWRRPRFWSVTWLYPAKFAYVRCSYHPFCNTHWFGFIRLNRIYIYESRNKLGCAFIVLATFMNEVQYQWTDHTVFIYC